MNKELWLEFGYLQAEQNNYHNMLWYNEGRWQELPYFLKNLWKYKFKKNMYFFWRYGKKNYYLKGKPNTL